jgi:hypothetical protein
MSQQSHDVINYLANIDHGLHSSNREWNMQNKAEVKNWSLMDAIMSTDAFS